MAIKIQSNHANAYHNLGNVLKEMGDFQKAKISYKKAFKFQPTNLETLDTLSSLDKQILDEIINRGKQNHISYFGFSGTPKNKTLELFGRKNEDGLLKHVDVMTIANRERESLNMRFDVDNVILKPSKEKITKPTNNQRRVINAEIAS